MTIADRVDAAAPAAPPRDVDSPLPSTVRPRFAGNRSDYWRLMIRGGVLQAITLGIYRFWLFTDARRFLWASTEVREETLEYTGTAVELLIGFLMAIGILVPVYALLFVASLELGLISRWSGVVAFLVLAGFGQYAVFRARRYRLTRTVFRGLRFHQGGSALRYAVRAMLWWVPAGITLGLAWPWAIGNLEHYKMRNTFYGNLGGGFAGCGGGLFWRVIVIWLLVVGPIVGRLAAAVTVSDWFAVPFEATIGGLSAIEEFSERHELGLVLLLSGATGTVLAGFALYPAYQAIVMRWWLGGLRLGDATIASDLDMRRYYGAYLRFLLYVLLFSIAFFVVAGIVFGLGYVALRGQIDFGKSSLLRDGLTTATTIVTYVILILGYSAIYQVVVKLRLWQAAVESMLISNLAALDHVQATEATSSGVGEGLADALGTGGI